MIRRPPRSTLFPTRRSSDLGLSALVGGGISAIASAALAVIGFAAPAGAPAERVARAFYVGEATKLAITVALFVLDRKSTRLNSSHSQISYAVFCLKKKKRTN